MFFERAEFLACNFTPLPSEIAFLLAGAVVLAVINIPRAKEYAVSLFHVIFHFMTLNQLDLPPLASSGRVRFEL